MLSQSASGCADSYCAMSVVFVNINLSRYNETQIFEYELI